MWKVQSWVNAHALADNKDILIFKPFFPYLFSCVCKAVRTARSSPAVTPVRTSASTANALWTVALCCLSAGTPALTHIHPLTHTFTHSHTHSPTLTHTFTHSHTHIHPLTHTFTRSHTHSPALTLITHSHTFTHSHTHTHSHRHSPSLTHSLTHLLTLWLTVWQYDSCLTACFPCVCTGVLQDGWATGVKTQQPPSTPLPVEVRMFFSIMS